MPVDFPFRPTTSCFRRDRPFGQRVACCFSTGNTSTCPTTHGFHNQLSDSALCRQRGSEPNLRKSPIYILSSTGVGLSLQVARRLGTVSNHFCIVRPFCHLKALGMASISNDINNYVSYESGYAPRHVQVGYLILSFVIGYIGSLSTLELLQLRTSTRGAYNWFLLAGSSVTMGGIGELFPTLQRIGGPPEFGVKAGDGSTV